MGHIIHPLVHGDNFDVLELESITEDNAADTTLSDGQYRAYSQNAGWSLTETARHPKSEMIRNHSATTKHLPVDSNFNLQVDISELLDGMQARDKPWR